MCTGHSLTKSKQLKDMLTIQLEVSLDHRIHPLYSTIKEGGKGGKGYFISMIKKRDAQYVSTSQF